MLEQLTAEYLERDAFDPTPIARLISSAFAVHPSMNGRDRISADGLLDEVGDDGRLVQFTSGGEPVACAVVRPSLSVDRSYERAWLDRHPAALHYGLAAVSPNHMGKRLGMGLLQAAERYASENGFQEVVLSALREWGNDRYYAGHGYATEDILRYTDRAGTPQHLHFMVKRIAAS